VTVHKQAVDFHTSTSMPLSITSECLRTI